jgi:molecular chaperone GrpE
MQGEEKAEKLTAENQDITAQETAEESEAEEITTKEIPLEQMKKKELVQKVSELQEKAEKNYDLFVRSQAEIENLKKRFAKDKQDLCKFSNESLIKQLLKVVDSLEKAIAHSAGDNSLPALRQGVELTLKSLLDSLTKEGLVEVKAEGEPFDPNFHEAVSVQEDPEATPGIVLQELQKGYLLNDRLIRPSLVIVSKAGDQEE